MRYRNDKWLSAARGQSCLFRGPTCNGDPETTVAAHLNGAGVAMKHHDLLVVDACSSCHAFIDGGYVRYGWSKQDVETRFLMALAQTMGRRLNEQGFRVESS